MMYLLCTLNHTYQTNFMFSREVLLLSWPLHQEDAHSIVYLLQVITVDFDTYYGSEGVQN
jgi:hypothetical protein